MGAADPSYPLLPIASVLAAFLLILVLLLASIRQQWNFGVAILCLWLLLENITTAVDTVIWSDNADVKLNVYCDIVSHLQVLIVVVKPMATLILTRRLYLIVTLTSVDDPGTTARRRERLLEWTLGVIIPLLVAGPIYYIDQSSRFEMDEGFGCTNALDSSILGLLILDSWSVILPLISITCYYPKVAREFYHRSRDVDRFLQSEQSDNSVSRTSYLRLFTLASIDILITLPNGIVIVVLDTTAGLQTGSFPFYAGWHKVHRDWTPPTYTYAELLEDPAYIAEFYVTFWSAIILSYAIFALFGTTAEARASYCRVIYGIGKWFGWKPTTRVANDVADSAFGTIQFNQQLEISIDIEAGTHPSHVSDDKSAARNETISGGDNQENSYREKELDPGYGELECI